jgi:small subunit ribosomal protein S4
MIKQNKTYTKPKNLFDKSRIASDKELTRKYGLKNKSEIWKADSEVNRIRTEAKKLIIEPEKQALFFKTLQNKGLLKSSEASIDNVLSLKKEDLLERRLQTFILKLGLAKTIKEARQLITHRKIKLKDRVVTIPSYLVKSDEEKSISLIKAVKKEKNNIKLNPEKAEIIETQE